MMADLKKPDLNKGEVWIGVTTGKNGDVYHVILLPGDNDDATFADALAWAKGIGGDLPTRVEQSMLWATHRDQFQKSWYWSNETHHKYDDYAWSQGFVNGHQDDEPKPTKLRARAVRRVAI